MNKIHDIISYAKTSLKDTTEQSEIQPILRIIFNCTMGWDFKDLIMHSEEKIDQEKADIIIKAIERIAAGEPVQYAMEQEEFRHLKLHLDRHTLIPRPETAELVELICRKSCGPKHILDIGTGSGCIAIALSKELEGSRTEACDIDEGALKIAARNAKENRTDIRFFRCDILKWQEYSFPQYDLIVSNPPYIMRMEAADMAGRVLEYEPHTALFVPDEDPMLFYNHIADMGKRHLKTNGAIWFEINEKLGDRYTALLKGKGYSDIILYQDSFGKDRFITAKWKKQNV